MLLSRPSAVGRIPYVCSQSLWFNQLVGAAEDLRGSSGGYTTAMWLGFGEALAAVAGALTGLLFVAVFVKSDVLAASRSLSSRAAQTLVLFMTSVIIALLLVAPQPPAALADQDFKLYSFLNSRRRLLTWS